MEQAVPRDYTRKSKFAYWHFLVLLDITLGKGIILTDVLKERNSTVNAMNLPFS